MSGGLIGCEVEQADQVRRGGVDSHRRHEDDLLDGTGRQQRGQCRGHACRERDPAALTFRHVR